MKTQWKGIIIWVAVATLAGCASGVGSGGTSQGTLKGGGNTGGTPANVNKAGAFDTEMAVKGGFSTDIDNAKFTVDYTDPKLNEGLIVKAGLSHRLVKTGKTCVPAITITVERKDSSCKLELEYKADFHGELRVADARFHAKAALLNDEGVPLETFDCDGWTDEPKKGQVVYEMVGGDAGVDIGGPLGQPYASEAEAKIPAMTIKTKGTIVMRYKGREFDMPLDNLSFTGSVMSKGGADVSCAQAHQPLPEVLLEDFNPKSKTYGQKVDPNDYKGKRVAVLMGAGW